MCGRYTMRKLRWADYGAGPRFEEFTDLKIVPRFNIAPSQPVPVVRLDKAGQRVGDLIRWGLVPSWTQGKPKQQPINARAETVASSGMFKQAFGRRRCLQAADGFYEWKRDGAAKQPYYIRLASDEPFAFAAIWERWRPDPAAELIDTCCHITTTPNEMMAPIHDRMPVILQQSDYVAWLDPATDPVKLLEMLKPFPADEMYAYPVSTAVNKPVNDTPDNVVPVAADW